MVLKSWFQIVQKILNEIEIVWDSLGKFGEIKEVFEDFGRVLKNLIDFGRLQETSGDFKKI